MRRAGLKLCTASDKRCIGLLLLSPCNVWYRQRERACCLPQLSTGLFICFKRPQRKDFKLMIYEELKGRGLHAVRKVLEHDGTLLKALGNHRPSALEQAGGASATGSQIPDLPFPLPEPAGPRLLHTVVGFSMAKQRNLRKKRALDEDEDEQVVEEESLRCVSSKVQKI